MFTMHLGDDDAPPANPQVRTAREKGSKDMSEG
jgi:hypothetical protein